MGFLSMLLGSSEDEETRNRRTVDEYFEKASETGEYGWNIGMIADLIPPLVRHFYDEEEDSDTALLYIDKLRELVNQGILPDPYQGILEGPESIYSKIMAAKGKRILRLLWLDNRDNVRGFRRELGAELLDRLEIEIRVWSPYIANPDELLNITRTSEAGIDYVVIGHNRGVGVERAGAVVESLRKNACVVWESYQEGIEEPYRELGYETFLARRDFVDHFVETMKAHV